MEKAISSTKINEDRQDRALNAVIGVVFVILTFLCVYPFYYLIINSISANDLSASGLINFWPRGIQFQNYIDVFKLSGLGAAAVVSLGRTVIGTIFTVLASIYLGYMFTQEKMWHRKFWYRFVVITMYFNAGLIPMFMTMKTLHLTNTFWVYIIPAIVQPFNIIMAKTYVESMPAALLEAAELDGASVMTRFWKIILPTSQPILATIAIWSAVGQWNSFQDTLIYITDQKLYTLQYLLYTYLNQASSLATFVKSSGDISAVASLATQQTPTSIRMTISVVVVLPILFVYPIFQKYFVKGIMIGSVKG
jgi:multiple sugar transport system permease protein/putative aldouronate transport system permease protein